MSLAVLAAFLLCSAVANASPAPVYQYQTRLDARGYEWVYVPGVGQVFVNRVADWETGRYTTLRHIEYFCPGKRAMAPEFVEQDRGTLRIRIRMIARPEYDYRGRVVGHWCDFLVTDVYNGIQWFPVEWQGAP